MTPGRRRRGERPPGAPERTTRNALRSWVCPTEADARRLAEASGRADAACVISAGITVVALLATIPWLGLAPFVLGIAGLLQVATVGMRTRWVHRPEWVNILSFILTSALFVSGTALTGGPESPLLPLCAMTILLLASRFRRQVAIAGVAFNVALVVGVMAAFFPRESLAHAERVAIPVLLMVTSVWITLSFSDVESSLRRRVHVDPLTGLLNRLGLDARFDEMVAASSEAGQPVSLVVMDLDHFKEINDTLGHDRGDRALVGVASILVGNLREVDLVFRLGGEEFAVLLPGVGVRDAVAVAERLRAAVGAEPLDGVRVTLSAGVAEASEHSSGWRGLYRRADAALLAAKRAGRDRTLAFEDITLPFGRHGRDAGTAGETRGAA